jgi:hypothetical protein
MPHYYSTQSANGKILNFVGKVGKNESPKNLLSNDYLTLLRILTFPLNAGFDLLRIFWRILDKNLSHFLNISSEEIDFKVWNCEKSSIIWRSKIVQLPYQKKACLKRLTNYRYVICENWSSIWYAVWEEIDFAVLKVSSC